MKAERSVCLNGLLCRAYIGVYEEERRDGGDFLIDAQLTMPCVIREEAVQLGDTMDYEQVLVIIKEILSTPELLLETVANRIVLSCREQFPQATGMHIHIQKKNPPLLAEVFSSGIKLDVRF